MHNGGKKSSCIIQRGYTIQNMASINLSFKEMPIKTYNQLLMVLLLKNVCLLSDLYAPASCLKRN